MVSDTSIKAYHEILAEGFLAAAQMRVAEVIRENPNNTDRMFSALASLPINIISARRNELVKMGIVEDLGSKSCSLTGRTAHHWQIKAEIEFRPLSKPKPI